MTSRAVYQCIEAAGTAAEIQYSILVAIIFRPSLRLEFRCMSATALRVSSSPISRSNAPNPCDGTKLLIFEFPFLRSVVCGRK